jgi:hypothetical protein
MPPSFEVLPWERILVPKPPRPILVPTLNACIISGEFFALSIPVTLNGISYSFGRYLFPHIDATHVYLQMMQTAVPLDGFQPHPCPLTRTYISYPGELVVTDIVARVSISKIARELFIFSTDAIEGDSDAARCIGMSNAYLLRSKYESIAHTLSSISAFDSFHQEYGSHSARSWHLVVKLAKEMTKCLCGGPLNQRLSRTALTSCSKDEWKYIKARLHPAINVFSRSSQLSICVHRARGYTETLKNRSKKEVMRIDTEEQLEAWKALVGAFTIMCHRKRAPKAPKLTRDMDYAQSGSPTEICDKVNVLANLSPNENEHFGEYVAYPKSRGISLIFSPVLGLLRIQVRYSSLMGSEPAVLAIISDASNVVVSSSSDDDDNDDVRYLKCLTVGLNLDHSEHGVLEVRSIEDDEVLCTIIEADNNSDLVLGDDVILTKTEAIIILRNELDSD